MSVKTITITEEAYRKLVRARREGESFTDVINRILGGPSILELAGILDPEVGDKVAEEVARMRREWDERVGATAKKLRA